MPEFIHTVVLMIFSADYFPFYSPLQRILSSIQLFVRLITAVPANKKAVLLASHFPALAALSADVFSQNLNKLYGLLFTFLNQPAANISPLPHGNLIVDLVAFTALLRLWQLYHIDGLWLFTLKKPVQFLINIGVKLFFHPFLL